jgi:hypothetical protein
MSNYNQTVAADRRLLILKALAEAHGYTAHARLLRSFLDSFGHAVSADMLASDLAWLAEQGLIALHADSIATLTPRGLDVAAGLALVPGVRRPEPGE